MRFILFIFLCWTAQQLGAQDFAFADTANPTGPALAYQSTAAAPATAPTELGERYSLRYRRERTLLGDLDLSGAWGGPTYNYSMTGDDWALVRGGFGGLEFSDEVFLGYGGWSSREDFTTDEPVTIGGVTTSPQYNFRHGGFIVGYAPLRDATVHPRFTVIIGPGRIDGGTGEFGRDRIFVGQTMAGVELNVFQWFRLGLEGGYRFAAGIEDNSPISARDVGGAVVQIEARFGFSW